jgi:hypothetical protein
VLNEVIGFYKSSSFPNMQYFFSFFERKEAEIHFLFPLGLLRITTTDEGDEMSQASRFHLHPSFFVFSQEE